MELKFGFSNFFQLTFYCMFTVAAAQPVVATTLHTTTIKCPVGGQEFQDIGISSYSTFGSRPDGKPYGTLEIFPLHLCPSNGFVIFDDNFTSEEISELERVVKTSEYNEVTATETSYYRAWWLANAIGRGKLELSNLLLQASWETDDNLTRKQRYQEKFIEISDAINSSDFEDSSAFWLALRNANAHRELGQFKQAKDRLHQLLNPVFWPSEPDELKGLALSLKGLSQLIEEKNPKSDPVNFMPESMGYFHCKKNPEQKGVEADSCDRLSNLSYRYEPESYDSDIDGAASALEAAGRAAEAATAAAAKAANSVD